MVFLDQDEWFFISEFFEGSLLVDNLPTTYRLIVDMFLGEKRFERINNTAC